MKLFRWFVVALLAISTVMMFSACQTAEETTTVETPVVEVSEVVEATEAVETTEQVEVTEAVVETEGAAVESEKPQLSEDALLTGGTLVLAADFGAPPSQYINTDGTMAGINVDMCTAIGDKLGLTVEWQNLSFPGLIPGLQANRFDALCTGVFINEERKEIMNMIPYVQWGEGLLIKAGDPANVGCTYTFGDNDSYTGCFENLIGKKVSVPAGGTTHNRLLAINEQFAAENKGQIELVVFDSAAESFQALVNDQVIGYYANDPSGLYSASEFVGEYEYAFSGYSPNSLAITTLKEDRELADAIKWALEEMKADGTYQNIMEKWGVTAVDSFDIQVAE